VLDKQDINVLIEALDAWVNKDAAGEILGTVLDAVLEGKVTSEVRTKIDHQRLKAAEDKELRKERAIMLASRLLQIRDGLVAEQALG